MDERRMEKISGNSEILQSAPNDPRTDLERYSLKSVLHVKSLTPKHKLWSVLLPDYPFAGMFHILGCPIKFIHVKIQRAGQLQRK